MAESKIKKDTKNIRILIAEDNELSRDNLAELLRSYGYEVKGVGDGRQAMDVFIDDSTTSSSRTSRCPTSTVFTC